MRIRYINSRYFILIILLFNNSLFLYNYSSIIFLQTKENSNRIENLHSINIKEIKNIAGNVSKTSKIETLGLFDQRSSPDFDKKTSLIQSNISDLPLKFHPIVDYIGISTLPIGTNDITSIDFSPDGKILASGDVGSTIKLWNITTGVIINTLSYTQPIQSLEFSPDGKSLAAAYTDSMIKVWNLTTNTETYSFTTHSSSVNSVTFSPDNDYLISGSSDQSIKLWDLNTGNEIPRFSDLTSVIWSVAYNPIGTSIAVGQANSSISLLDVNTGNTIKTLNNHNDDVKAVDFSTDGSMLVSGSYDRNITLWNTASGNPIRTFEGHTGQVRAIGFSSDNKLVVSGSRDDTVRVWNVSTGLEIKNMTEHAPNDVWAVKFHPSSTIVASGARDNTIKLWNYDLVGLNNTIPGHDTWSWPVAFNPDGTILASGAADTTNNLKLWDINTGNEIDTLVNHSHWVLSLAFNLEGTILASGSRDGTIKFWNVSTRKEINSETIMEHIGWIKTVAFSPDGTILASGSTDQVENLKLWDVSSKTLIASLNHSGGGVESVTFNSDGKLLVSASTNDTIKIWDVNSKTEISTLTNHTSDVNSVAFNSNGSILASGSSDSTIRLWNISSRELITYYNHTDEVNCVSFSPNAKLLAACASDGSVRVWNLSSRVEIVTFNNPNSVFSIAFNPRGDLIAASSQLSNPINLWRVGTFIFKLKKEVQPLIRVNSNIPFEINSNTSLWASWGNDALQLVTNSTSFKAPSTYQYISLNIKTAHLSKYSSISYQFCVVEELDDFDGDGIPNSWEEANGTDSFNDSDSLADPDKDGLNNLGEYQNNTFPFNPDTDDDGWFDGSEISNASNPLDPNPPPFVTWPASLLDSNGSVVNDSTWDWQITASSAFLLDIWQNGNNISTLNPPFNGVIDLFEGVNNLTFVAYYDIPSNTNVTYFEISLDLTPPTFSLINLNSGAILKSKSLITIRVENYTELFSYWDTGSFKEIHTQPQEIAVSNRVSTPHLKCLVDIGTQNHSFELPGSDGLHTLYLKAVDELGNVDYADYSFITDDTPPTAIIQGIDPILFGKRTIRVIPEDNNSIDRVEFEISGELMSTDNSSPYRWEWNTAETVDGIYLIRIHVYDIAGNQYTKEFPNIFVVNNPISFLVQTITNNIEIVLLIILIFLLLIIIIIRRKKMHILYLYANPKAAPLEFDPEREFNSIYENIKKAKHGKKIRLFQRGGLTRKNLPDWLSEPKIRPHIVHFSGHGIPEFLQFVDPVKPKLGDMIPIELVSKTFGMHKNRIRIVILRACYSKELAESLLKHIDFVIGMSTKIQDDAAREFSIGFYTFLAAGKTISKAFENGKSRMELIKEYGGEIPQLAHRKKKNPSKTRLFRRKFLFFL